MGMLLQRVYFCSCLLVFGFTASSDKWPQPQRTSALDSLFYLYSNLNCQGLTAEEREWTETNYRINNCYESALLLMAQQKVFLNAISGGLEVDRKILSCFHPTHAGRSSYLYKTKIRLFRLVMVQSSGNMIQEIKNKAEVQNWAEVAKMSQQVFPPFPPSS